MDRFRGMNREWQPIPIDIIAASWARTASIVLRTPLIRLDADDVVPPGTEIWLKLECLQPVRSFKLRGAANALALLAETDPAALTQGVWTVSTGNMAQALSYAARAFEVPCTVFVPETAPRAKLSNVLRYGGAPVAVSPAEFEAICLSGCKDGVAGHFVHPYSDPNVMAGAGVVGLEILEDLPDVDAVVAPWGGGGLTCGVASALRALRPEARIYASEIDTGAPLAAALAAGQPTAAPFTPSFVDGISAPFISPEMFALAREMVDGALVVDRDATASAIRLVAERTRVIAEGAAATAVAAALSGMAGSGRIACVVSGGNIDAKKLAMILNGSTPA